MTTENTPKKRRGGRGIVDLLQTIRWMDAVGSKGQKVLSEQSHAAKT